MASIIDRNKPSAGNPSLGKRPIISVKEARKLLGSNQRNYSDSDIKLLVNDCEQLARLSIRQYLVRKSHVVK